MPFISDAQLSKIQGFVANQRNRASRAAAKAEEKAGEMKSTLECVGAAAAMGYARGKMEDASGVWNVPLVKFDVELVAGTALVAGVFFDLFGKYDEDALNVGNGILAHYAGQVMRKTAKTGSFTQVAGAGHAPHQLPGMSMPMGSPHADPVAAALADSELY